MPEVSSNSKFWLRGGKQSQKRHVAMSEETKQHTVKCTGIKKDHPCKNPVFRCGNCGNLGCAQIVLDKCSRQGFKNDICLNCGTKGHRTPVPEEECDAYMKHWQAIEAEI